MSLCPSANGWNYLAFQSQVFRRNSGEDDSANDNNTLGYGSNTVSEKSSCWFDYWTMNMTQNESKS